MAGDDEARRYRAFFEASPIPMWTYDTRTLRFVDVNEAATRRYGYARDEFLQMTLADIRPPEDVAAVTEDVRRAAGYSAAQLWRHKLKDGSLITVEVMANDLTLDGSPLRLVQVIDVTERVKAQQALRRTEEQLRQAQKMEAIGKLAGGVAHDFNNILTVIGSFAGLLEESLPPDDERHHDAAEIRRAAERAAALTRQLLTLSRHSIAAPRSVNLDEIVTGLAPMLRRLLGEQIEIVTHLGGVPAVTIDPGQMDQVVMNLAVNARDAMPEGGRLTIETRAVELDDERFGVRAGRYVELAITDTGTGMDAEVQARVFDPFFTTKAPGQGTGFGLSIVHGIVTQAGGAVTVYSELGHGSTFRVFLPVGTEEIAAPRERRASEAPVLVGVAVLVVDDDDAVRGTAVRVLRDAGCVVVAAATAATARAICADAGVRIDVVLLDVILTDGRGDKLAPELRALRPGLPIILMSGYPAGALSAQGGAPADLLAKPFSPRELRAAVARAAAATR